MKRILSTVIASLFLLPISYPSAEAAKAAKAKKMAGYIGIVEGRAMVLLDGAEPWVKAEVGQQLTPGTQVKTHAGSRVTVAFTDGSKVRIGANAKFRLDTVKPSKVAVFIGLGKLEGWVKKMAGRTFLSRNPVSVASVRGTVFAQDVDSSGNAQTRVFSGSVINTDNFGRSTSLGARQQQSTDSQSGSAKPGKVPPNITAPAEPPVSIPQIASAGAPTTPLEDDSESGEDADEVAAEDAEDSSDSEDASGTSEDAEGTTETNPAQEEALAPNPIQDTSTVSSSSP